MVAEEAYSTPESPHPIERSKILVVEGRDDEEFCNALLRHLSLSQQIEVRETKGRDKQLAYLESLVIESNFRKKVVSLGIIRDADEDAQAAFSSVCSALLRLQLSVPAKPAEMSHGKPSTAVFIFPDCSNSGEIEHLCLQAVADDPAMPCIEQYFQCLHHAGVKLPDNNSVLMKAKVKAFIASRQEPTVPLGRAAQKQYWNFDSPVYDPIKQFLKSL